MPTTQFGNNAAGGNYAMWNKGFWSRKQREADSIAEQAALDEAKYRLYEKQKRLDEQIGESSADKDLTRRKDMKVFGSDVDEGVSERSDKRRGITAEGQMAERKAELDQAGHAARLSRAPSIALSASEAEAINAARALEDAKFGQENDPTLRGEKLKADIGRYKGIASKGLYDADMPGAPIAAQLLDSLIRSDTARKVSEDRSNDKVGGKKVGLEGTGANVMPSSIRIEQPKEQKEAGTGMFDQDTMDMLGGLLKKMGGGAGAGAGGAGAAAGGMGGFSGVMGMM